MPYHIVKDFAYPGWRLSIPGGPAGGQHHGYTHGQSEGSAPHINDQFDADRQEGMSSHDAEHASEANPRGVYRSSGEVPPRPNASGSYHTTRGGQTKHHAGQSVAPGSFPADYTESAEDSFIKLLSLTGLGDLNVMVPGYGEAGGPGYGAVITDAPVAVAKPNVITLPTNQPKICPAWGCGPKAIGPIYSTQDPIVVAPAPGVPVVSSAPATPPATGATNTVAQPAPTPTPTPPAQAVAVVTAQPVSPTPAPIVATNQVVPLNDGSGNYVNLSTGATVTPSQVTQNPYTMQLVSTATAAAELVPASDGSGNYVNPQTGAVIPAAAINATAANTLATTTAASTASSTWNDAVTWLEGSTLISGIPNWGIALAAGAALMLLMRKRR